MAVIQLILILLLQNFCEVSPSYAVYEDESYLIVECISREYYTELKVTLDENLPRYPQPMSYEKLSIDYCPEAPIPLESMLVEHNITVAALRRLELRINRSLNSSEFEGLPIDEIIIETRPKREFDVEVLQAMRDLKTMTLTGVILMPLPADSKLVKVSLTSGSSSGEWGGCIFLEELVLNSWDARLVPDSWLSECQKLRSLTIVQSNTEIVNKILRSATPIKHLKMESCGLTMFPVEMSNLVQLEVLKVPLNMIANINLDDWKTSTKLSLQEVDLQYNYLIRSDEIAYLISKLPGLVNLSVAYNPKLNFCLYNGKSLLMTSPMRSLKRFSAAHTATSRLCFGEHIMDTLEHLDLSYSSISSLSFKDLPVSNLRIINLEGNPIREVSLEKKEYENLSHVLNVTGVDIDVDCDCANAWLARAVRDNRLEMRTRCLDRTPLALRPAESFECDRYSCDACTCRRLWRDNTTNARCGGELNALPALLGAEGGLSALYAAGNLISAINTTELPSSLILLDLRRNRIPRISAAEAAALFKERGRVVLLSGNPFVCDCAARPLLLALRTHRTQVEDYDRITCVNDGRLASEVSLDELCAEQLAERAWPIAGPLISAVILAGLFSTVYYRFGHTIKEFLFTRGYCLCCVHEEDIDEDRPYDAFVSFSHLDDEFVTEQLLPELEAVRRYRLCVHYRDWAVGAWIPEQISHSVHLSKRVIIVLSRNFVVSMWALMEFRLAQVEALEKRRARLIVVVLDDVLEDNQLNAEIKSYLAMNTYVKWGDPWFWEKMTFAMPHKENEETRVTRV